MNIVLPQALWRGRNSRLLFASAPCFLVPLFPCSIPVMEPWRRKKIARERRVQRLLSQGCMLQRTLIALYEFCVHPGGRLTKFAIAWRDAIKIFHTHDQQAYDEDQLHAEDNDGASGAGAGSAWRLSTGASSRGLTVEQLSSRCCKFC